MKLLLHACCGPCACYPSQLLAEEGTDFTLLYYNPNIHPYKEFKRRLSALRELAEKQLEAAKAARAEAAARKRVCPHCGASSAGMVCEYCGMSLDP